MSENQHLTDSCSSPQQHVLGKRSGGPSPFEFGPPLPKKQSTVVRGVPKGEVQGKKSDFPLPLNLFDLLPNEILCIIFKFLDPCFEGILIRHTCRRWRKAIQSCGRIHDRTTKQYLMFLNIWHSPAGGYPIHFLFYHLNRNHLNIVKHYQGSSSIPRNTLCRTHYGGDLEINRVSVSTFRWLCGTKQVAVPYYFLGLCVRNERIDLLQLLCEETHVIQFGEVESSTAPTPIEILRQTISYIISWKKSSVWQWVWERLKWFHEHGPASTDGKNRRNDLWSDRVEEIKWVTDIIKRSLCRGFYDSVRDILGGFLDEGPGRPLFSVSYWRNRMTIYHWLEDAVNGNNEACIQRIYDILQVIHRTELKPWNVRQLAMRSIMENAQVSYSWLLRTHGNQMRPPSRYSIRFLITEYGEECAPLLTMLLDRWRNQIRSYALTDDLGQMADGVPIKWVIVQRCLCTIMAIMHTRGCLRYSVDDLPHIIDYLLLCPQGSQLDRRQETVEYLAGSILGLTRRGTWNIYESFESWE